MTNAREGESVQRMSSRPEARPVHWSLLDEAQVKGFHGALKALVEVARSLKARQVPPRSDDPSRWLSPDRSSQIVFISGTRGTGKTTVLTSLIASSQTDSVTASLDSSCLMEREDRLRQMQEDVGRWLQEVRGRLVWLEPLDMEPAPRSLNLLLAILARIDAATSRSGARGGPVTGGAERERDYWAALEPATDYQEALLELERLQTNIAVAWESNLEARAPHLDPDSYAVEVKRAESARLSLNRNLEIVLDKLANSAFRGRNPLFVLPIDDLDLNPSACLALLNLLRMISVPRLFTVVLGDLEVAETVVSLRVSNDLATAAETAARADLLSMPRDAITAMAGDLAANVIRKLIPPGQRTQLEPLTILEALNFRPLGSGDDAPRLHGLLANCRVSLELPPHPSTGSPETLRDFLLVSSFPADMLAKPTTERLVREDLERRPYTALSYLRTTPRRIVDLWLSLPQGAGAAATSATGRPVNVLDLAAEGAQMALSEERAFDPAERRAVLSAIQREHSGVWTLEPLPIRAVPRLDPEQSLTVYPQEMSPGASARIRVRRSRGWRFAIGEGETARRGEDDQPERGPSAGGSRGGRAEETGWRPFMAEDTAAALVLFHDLLALGPGSDGFVSPLLRKDARAWLWALTEWRSPAGTTAELIWPFPPCASFWEWDLFLKAWNDGIAGMTRSEQPSVDSLPRLAALWIVAGSAVVMGAIPDFPGWPDVDPNHVWTEARMKPLATLASSRRLRSHWASEWLIDLAFFLMPESGIRKWEDHQQFSDSLISDSLISFWKSDQRLEVIRQRRAQRLAQLRRGQDPKSPMGPIADQLERTLRSVFRDETVAPARRPRRTQQ